MRFTSSLRFLALALSMLLGTATTRAAIPNPDAVDPVEQARNNAVRFLYRVQNVDNWEIAPQRKEDNGPDFAGRQWGGLTALAVDGLLRAGENWQRPELQKFIVFLNRSEITGTRALAWKVWMPSNIGRLTPEQKSILKKDGTLLLSHAIADGDDAGLFGAGDAKQGNADLLISNDAILAMQALVQSNFEVPAKFWKLADQGWRKRQQKDGGWSDARGAGPSTIAATASGIATLLSIHEALDANKNAETNGNFDDPAIASGLKWLADHSDEILKEPDLNYTLYQLARVGRSAGTKYFGKFNWHQAGMENLLKTQKEDGSWESPQGPVAGTAWALIFVTMQRDPILLNKLSYTIQEDGKRTPGHWNQRPRDAANLAEWLGRQLCYWDLNWHVANLEMSPLDLHDAPILYIAGDQPLDFTQPEKAKLKLFVQQGGLIVGQPDGNSLPFKISFEKLGQELFPDYPIRDLPANHLLYTTYFKIDGTGKLAGLRGQSNGARELMLLMQNDIARYWQAGNFHGTGTRTAAELPANIYLYTDRARNYRSPTPELPQRDEKIKASKTIKIARLQYKGNWDPEPGGWPRLANMMHNERAIDLDVQTVALGGEKLTKDYAVAHLTGTADFQLTEPQRNELKAYVEKGGTLVIDSTGGGAEFAKAAATELSAIFPDAAAHLSPLPESHAIYSASASKANKVEYRNYARRTMLGDFKSPRLRGIEIAGRTAVIFSAEDLSVGLVGTNVDGILGYEPVWASELMANVIVVSGK